MELNLRLDQNGRTTFDPAALQQHQGEAIPKKCSTAENVAKRAKIEATSETTVDYSSKTTLTSLHDYKIEGAMDSLLFDCEVCCRDIFIAGFALLDLMFLYGRLPIVDYYQGHFGFQPLEWRLVLIIVNNIQYFL